MQDLFMEREKQSTSPEFRSELFSDLLVHEYLQIGRTLLAYEVSGRLVFTLLTFAFIFSQFGLSSKLSISLVILIFGLIWTFRTWLVDRRQRELGRLIIEAGFESGVDKGMEDWSTTTIKYYHHVYGDPGEKVAHYLTIIEPLAWVALSTLVLFFSKTLTA